jgi:hypothetical protein
MRRPALALVLSLLLATPARAQDRGEPIVGGGSFGSAPLLQAGRFHDTILPGEYLYYGFRLAAGQRLRITLTHPDIDNRAVQELGVIGLSGRIHNPARTVDTLPSEEGDHADLGFGLDEREPLIVSSPDVTAEPDGRTERLFKNAGTYYLALHTLYSGHNTPPRAEIPFTFAAEITGTAQPNVTPAATPTATGTPKAKATATAVATPAGAASDSGPPAALAAVFGVGGILIGVIAGIARRGRRR